MEQVNRRVMVYTPLAPMEPLVHALTLESLLLMTWGEPFEVVLGRHDVDRWPDLAQAYRSIAAKYEWARQAALAGGYDALLTVESDMVVPSLALERMMEVDADVVYALYVSRHGAHQWLAFGQIHGKEGRYRGDTMSNHPDLCREAWGKVVETQGVGLGCTLVRRKVLESIEFHCPDTMVANDWHFALDVRAAGFKQVHDLGTVCGHISEAGVLWPTEDGGWRVG